MIQWTVMEAGALTVAGQWRSFTAFPNILVIAVMREPPEVSCRQRVKNVRPEFGRLSRLWGSGWQVKNTVWIC